MYFGHFPLIPYDSVGDGKFKLVTNLLKRIAVRSKVKTNVLVFDTYDVKSGETPELIADKLYNDPELHWVVLMMNDITDRYHQWPLTENQFLAHINDKYDNVDATHHYEISQTSGDTTIKIEVENSTYPSATIVTNYEYEVALNESKRKIDLLRNDYLGFFTEEFASLI